MIGSQPGTGAYTASATAKGFLVALALPLTALRRAVASHRSRLNCIQKTRVQSLHRERHCQSRTPGQQDLTDLGLESVVLSRTGHERAVKGATAFSVLLWIHVELYATLIDHLSQHAWGRLAELPKRSSSLLRVPWRSAARPSDNYQSC